MNGMYSALKLAHQKHSMNTNHYLISLLIITAVEVCLVGSIFHNQNTEKGGDREGKDGQIRVKESVVEKTFLSVVGMSCSPKV